MFETAISYGPPSHRVWTTFMGMAGQAILVACAIAIPLWFPAALPRPQAMMAWLSAPLPPQPAPAAPAEAIVAPKARPFQFVGSKLQTPVNIPTHVAMIEDPPSPPGAVFAEAGKTISDFLTGVLPSAAARAAAPAAAPEVREVAPPAPPHRYRVGSVRPAVVLSRVTPVYPALAQQLRIAGTVEVEGVIGLDGRIHELHVKSGHPLLAPAAMAAVAQWLFRPTTLNGDPVEVVQTVVVNFVLK